LIIYIYINDTRCRSQAGIVITDLADHFGTYCITDMNVNKNKQTKISKRIYSEQNIRKFNIQLRDKDFSHIMNNNCPIQAFELFHNIFKDTFEKVFPIVNFQSKSNNFKHEPCMSIGLLISLKHKMNLIVKHIRFT